RTRSGATARSASRGDPGRRIGACRGDTLASAPLRTAKSRRAELEWPSGWQILGRQPMPRWLGKASYFGLAAGAAWLPLCLTLAILITDGRIDAPQREWFEPRAPELWTLILPLGFVVAFVGTILASALGYAILPLGQAIRAPRIRHGRTDIRRWA